MYRIDHTPQLGLEDRQWTVIDDQTLLIDQISDDFNIVGHVPQTTCVTSRKSSCQKGSSFLYNVGVKIVKFSMLNEVHMMKKQNKTMFFKLVLKNACVLYLWPESAWVHYLACCEERAVL